MSNEEEEKERDKSGILERFMSESVRYFHLQQSQVLLR